MKLDSSLVDTLSVDWTLSRFLRVTPLAHAATPLGMGFGKTRFASPSQSFKVLYLGTSLITSVAETIVRDRFVDRVRRRLMQEELESWGATEIATAAPLRLLDLRGTAVTRLGIPTDAVNARNQTAGRRFSELLYAQVPYLDGVAYSSRVIRTDCVAVYDRAVHKLRPGPVVPIVALSDLVPALLKLDISVVPKS